MKSLGLFAGVLLFQLSAQALSSIPSAPSIYSAQALSSSEIQISWYASRLRRDSIQSYLIFRDGAKIGTVAGSVTTYKDSGLAAGTSYQYQVQALSLKGVLSAVSTAVSATTQSGIVVQPPPSLGDGTIPVTASEWKTEYDGFGSVTYFSDSVLFQPKASTSPDETHAVLLLSNRHIANPIKDFRITVVVKDEAQLRSPTPNAWECFWLFFNYNQTSPDNKRTNYITFKPNGVEMGRAYGFIGQDFLFTSASPQTPIGTTYTMVIEKRGGKLMAYKNGVLVMSYDSSTGPYPLYDDYGTIGLYNEDAQTRVYSIKVEPL